MEFFLNYFTPAITLLIFSLLPMYFVRVAFFVQKSHFIDEKLSLNLSLYIHIFIYTIFIILLFFSTRYISELALYIFGLAMIVFLGILLGYRKKFENLKRHRYIVLFSKLNNRDNFQKFLDEKKYLHIDISDGAFSFVTRIKFNDTKDDEIVETFREFEQAGLLHSFSSVKGLMLFALNNALFFGAIISFIIFFIYIPRLG